MLNLLRIQLITRMQEANSWLTLVPSMQEQTHQDIKRDAQQVMKRMLDQCQIKIKCGPFQNYFMGQHKMKERYIEIENKYNKLVQQRLEHDLYQGTVIINKKKQLPFKNKIETTTQSKTKIEKEELQKQKKQAINNLNYIYQREAQFIKRNKYPQKSQSQPHLVESSRYENDIKNNPEWKAPLIQAVKRNRQFQTKVKQKSAQFDQKCKIMKQQQIKAEQHRLNQLRQKNHKQMQARKAKQEQQKNKLLVSTKQCKTTLKKVKPSKYIHQILDQKYQQLNKSLQEERQQQLQRFKEKRIQQTWNQIKHHQESYLSKLNRKKQQWLSTYKQKIKTYREAHHQGYHSVFQKRIKQYQQEIKQQDKNNQEKGHKQLQKIKSYSEYVLQNFKPKVVTDHQIHLQNQNHLKHIRQSLSSLQQRTKGLDYLNQSKKAIKSSTTTQQILSKDQKSASLPQINNRIYQNYLKDQPKRSKHQTSTSAFRTALSERKGDWAAQAYTIINKMESTKLKGDKPLFASVNHKLKLLQALI